MMAILGNDLNSRLVEIVQSETSDFCDLDAESSVDTTALDAQQNTLCNAHPIRVLEKKEDEFRAMVVVMMVVMLCTGSTAVGTLLVLIGYGIKLIECFLVLSLQQKSP